MKEIAIIGGGIIGLALAYKISLQNKNKVTVFEKESKLGMHQSTNNSGVLHCGLHYKPGSLKSKLAKDGFDQLIKFSGNHKIEYDLCGKILVANTDEEIENLDVLAGYGSKNGLNGLKFLSKSELKNREPNVKSEKTLLVPDEGIISFQSVVNKLQELILNNGGKIFLNKKIINCSDEGNKVNLRTQNEEWIFDTVINCGGLFTDRNYKNLTQEKSPISIIPFRGEYLFLKDNYKDLFNHLVYPVPNIKFPFLGVHFTRTIEGKKEVGPNAVLALKREGYKSSDMSLKDSIEIMSNNGFLSFLKNNFQFSINEFKSSLSKKEFTKKAKSLIPEIEEYMLEKGNAGVRAQAISNSGTLMMDFNIVQKNNQIHILNAPSPGATSSLAIADYILENFKI